MNNDRIWILQARKLSGEASSTELKELEQLLLQYPEADPISIELATHWESAPSIDADFMEATWLAHAARMHERGYEIRTDQHQLNPNAALEEETTPLRKNFFKRTGVVVGAAIFIVSGLFFLNNQIKTATLAPTKNIVAQQEVKTPNGSRTKIQLPDGSDVWLNAGSELKYNKDFEKGNREVYLSGEAFFDVVRNPKKPFVIHTSSMDVKVLGTQFNVKAYEDDLTTETSLIKGSVAVYLNAAPEKEYRLVPNQKLILNNQALIKQQLSAEAKNNSLLNLDGLVTIKTLTYAAASENDVESSWTKNILSFEDELFPEVARKMERWYNVEIEFANQKWEQRYISGSFEKESLSQALKALQFTTGFNYKIEGKTILIY